MIAICSIIAYTRFDDFTMHMYYIEKRNVIKIRSIKLIAFCGDSKETMKKTRVQSGKSPWIESSRNVVQKCEALFKQKGSSNSLISAYLRKAHPSKAASFLFAQEDSNYSVILWWVC